MLSLPAIALRDHLILCDADRLRVLDPAARRLWEIGRETGDPARAVAWLIETYGLTKEQAERDVGAVFATAAPEVSGPPKNAPSRPVSRRNRAASADGRECHYHLFDRPFSLHCATAELARAIEPLFAHLRVDAAAGPGFDIAVDDDGFTLWRDQESLLETNTLDGAVVGLFGEILQYACAERDSIATLHAGAVSDGHTCLVLPALGGSGKSTLTAALLTRGYRYLSDDVVPLERGSGHAVPVPVCLNLKPGSLPALADLYPELPDLPAWRSGDRRLRFLPPPEFARRRPDRAYPVAALVFPRYRPDAAPKLDPLDPITTLARLMESDVLFDLPLNPAIIGEFCAWIEATPAYALSYGSLAQATEILADLWP